MMTSLLKVYKVTVSEKTTWVFLRLIGPDRFEGIGEATANRRVDNVLAKVAETADAASRASHGLGAKLQAARAHCEGVIGRAISSGLEQAWLDREGRRANRPIHTLLGGRYRSTVPCYANINRGTLSRLPEEFAERAVRAVADGYTAVKLAPFDDVRPESTNEDEREALIEAAIARVQAVAEAVAGQARINVDCHSRLRPGEAANMLGRLADIGISWFEEPIAETTEALDNITRLREQAKTRGVTLAGAEQSADLQAFLPFCQHQCYDVIMPDIVLAGGPAEVMRIAHFANSCGIGLSLHNPCGPVMDMHSAQVAAAAPKLHSLERQFRESALYDDLVGRSNIFEAGAYNVGDAPGLGLEIDWASPHMELVLEQAIEL
ncbi:MAG: mandelate racemase/muconate lactonizing enzyme family protein [Hyphomicrobiaceae bacterium]